MFRISTSKRCNYVQFDDVTGTIILYGKFLHFVTYSTLPSFKLLKLID